ncbi:SIMPL domain-containing protein [Marivita sp. XM-24bin2]|uniref:SIMPL domain-containing protein n=1 Tax=unclassified Marivita TaxID=2632480 RepID=UPI0025C34FCA|nr:SIMPL domain-containing protein [Marivita sp. XM-24bin2]MCR9108641.1 SIMPL domain-containing protein [Paracoccaceae bacterium]
MPNATGFIAALLVLIGMSPLWADDLPGRITVTGEGRVFAVPDMAVVTMGATAEAETAKAAMDETSVMTNAILERLAEAGVAERDVQTSDLRLMPVRSNRTSSDTRPEIDGYQASNRVTVRVRDLASLGNILDAVLTDGANQLGGLQFVVSDPEPLLNEARVKAVADARARAELFAEAAGVTLGPLVSLSEAGAQFPRSEMMGLARASDAGMPIAQGEAELSANVTLVYEIGSE